MISELSVFHGLHNIAGIPSSLATSERNVGLNSKSVCYPTKYCSDEVDEFITGDPAVHFSTYLENYDIFNFHFGNSFTGQSLTDLQWLKNAGKKILLHYHGCDIRDSKVAVERHPISVCAECWPMACLANRTVSKDVRRRFADVITVSTPDLLEFEPGAIWLPQAVNFEYVLDTAERGKPAFERRDDATVYIVHAPSSSHLKGSRFIERAIDNLKMRGVKVELVLLTGMPHESVLASLRHADLVVDQVLTGAYGVVAIEAMTLGKPTLCYIRDDLKEHFPDDLPIVNGRIPRLEQDLLAFIEDRAKWPELETRSTAYARRHHDGRAVAQRMAELYARI